MLPEPLNCAKALILRSSTGEMKHSFVQNFPPYFLFWRVPSNKSVLNLPIWLRSGNLENPCMWFKSCSPLLSLKLSSWKRPLALHCSSQNKDHSEEFCTDLKWPFPLRGHVDHRAAVCHVALGFITRLYTQCAVPPTLHGWLCCCNSCEAVSSTRWH